ncbi:MAG: host attachment protein [Planctomycetaceae bacterium]
MSNNNVAKTVWILVADRGKARLLARTADETTLNLVQSFESSEGLSHVSELVSDQQGRFRGRTSPTSTGDSQSNLKRHSTARFAREIVKKLEDGRQKNHFSELELIVAPAFLGAVRSALTASLQHMVTRAVARDYTAFSINDLEERLPKTAKPEPKDEKEETFLIEELDDTLVITLTGNLGALAYSKARAEAEAILRTFESSFEKRHVVLDFKACDYFGSAGIGFFIRLWTQVRSRGGSMAVCNASPLEQELLTLTRMDKLWPVYSSLEEAIEAVQNDVCIQAGE